MEENSASSSTPFVRSHSTDGDVLNSQVRSLSHSITLPIQNSRILTEGAMENSNFQRRTVDGARQLRDNLNSVIRGIQPLVDTARIVNARTIAISSFLNRPQAEQNIAANTIQQNNSFIINVDDANENAQNIPDNPEPILDNQNENQNNPEEPHNERNIVEAQLALKPLQKYIPFILILLTKCLYDHHEGILNFAVLFIVFAYSNSVVKKEATKRSRRNCSKLLLSLLYISLCIFFINYIFEEEKLYMSLIFIRTFEKPLSVWDLLWVVGITDFILKLITVVFKILLTLTPEKIIAFQKRGKIYLFLEATSQLYRSLATLQPWLYYLLDSYQGPEKIVGVFLSAAYMVSKGADIMSRLKLLKAAMLKLLQNVTVGSSPSKEQIQVAGEHCPICHDEYDSPVLLQCRHIFCESCVTTWFDREQTCPLCRAKIVDDPSWRDGSTTFFMQLF